MHQLALKAYGEATKSTADDRQIERLLFQQVTSALEQVAKSEDPSPTDWATAISRNADLWSILATDLVSPENQLPLELKTGLLNLASFVTRESLKVLSGTGKIADLIEINQSILKGLGGQTGEEQVGEAA